TLLPPTRLPPPPPLFPYATLFRSPTHRLHLLLDGAPYGEPTSDTRIELVNVDRGEHSLAVEVINAAGETVQRSEPVTFTVQRVRSEEHTSELQSRENLVCRLLLEK